jgi:dTDP-6-deoxy-L-talose 4-dehydrogenase (NAD+)
MKSIIVTGATGFVGRHMIPYLLNKGFKVIAVGKNKDKAKQFSWFDDVQFHEIDFHKSFLELPSYNNIGLLHLAWGALENINASFHFEVVLPKNYDFIKDLINKGVSNVLVTGTWMEYGIKNGEFSPTTPTNPMTPYAFAKVSLQKQLGFLGKEHTVNIKWARLFSIYGEGQDKRGVISQLDEAIKNGDKNFNMSSGEQIRDFMSIENVVEELVDLYARDSSGIYNICSENPISIRSLVEKRIKDLKSNIKPNFGYYPISQPLAFWGKK